MHVKGETLFCVSYPQKSKFNTNQYFWRQEFLNVGNCYQLIAIDKMLSVADNSR